MSSEAALYYNYAVRMLEGEMIANSISNELDTVNGQTTDLVSTQQIKPVDSQFKSLIISAGVGVTGALACIKYLDKVFAISNIRQFGVILGHKASEISIAVSSWSKTGDAIGTAFANAVGAMGKAIRWVAKYLDKLQQGSTYHRKMGFGWKVYDPSFFGKTIGSSSITYGTVISVALAGAMIGMIIYKCYRLIKKMIGSKKTSENWYNNGIIKMNRYITESTTIMKKFSRLTEGDYESVSTVKKIIDKSRPFIDDMWNWATKTPFHLLATVITGMLVSFINWIIIIIAVCKAGIVCYDKLINES